MLVEVVEFKLWPAVKAFKNSSVNFKPENPSFEFVELLFDLLNNWFCCWLFLFLLISSESSKSSNERDFNCDCELLLLLSCWLLLKLPDNFEFDFLSFCFNFGAIFSYSKDGIEEVEEEEKKRKKMSKFVYQYFWAKWILDKAMKQSIKSPYEI